MMNKKLLKDKRGFLWQIYLFGGLALILGILVFLAIFGPKIASSVSDVFSTISNFFDKYGIYLLILVILVVFYKPIIIILRWILSKFGVKI